ncbi:TIGR02646 family protein [Vibrio parahaemolyticus]|nr:TIGR02646 family protein [Vibrio parahaemolyticus]HCG7218182.1 TIGR02646 family protein [Vibrio parahaemolyticus]
MIEIKKGREPASLIRYRNRPDALYDGPNFTVVKDDIRDSLLKEQGFLCAYCMCRVKKTKMKVEHYRCQHSHPSLQLTYTNLFACCMGNEGSVKKKQTCDTKKGSDSLSIDLLSQNPLASSLISYNSSGKIKCSDSNIDTELNEVLNLNQRRLVANRKAVLEAVESELGKKRGLRSRAEITSLLKSYTGLDTNYKYKEYCGVAKFYLEKRLQRAT